MTPGRERRFQGRLPAAGRHGETLASVEQAASGTDSAVRSLAWKILYANHRPSLGPETWDSIVSESGGPVDIKGLPVDESLPRRPFLAVLDQVARAIAEDREEGMRRIGESFARRWGSMYQTLVEHLDRRPERMLEVALQEVYPWFFGDEAVGVEQASDGEALVEPSPRMPWAFQAGFLEGMLEQTGSPVSVDREQGRLRASWQLDERPRPHPVTILAEATRARFLTGTLAPVLVGSALAFQQGLFSPVRAGAALAAAAALHLSANLLNDVYDHRQGVDAANLTPTPFSGGSRVIQRGLLESRRVLGFALGLALVGVGIGSWLALQSGPAVWGLGVIGVALGYAYSADPFRLSHRGLGEAVVGVVFGPLLTAGALLVQVGSLTGEGLLAGIPVGLMMAGLLAVNELPDARWDERTGKRTLVVRLGTHAPWGIALVFTLAYVSIAVLAAAGLVPWMAAGALATVPLAVHVLRGVQRADREPSELVPYQAGAFWLHATTALLFAAGIAVGGGL